MGVTQRDGEWVWCKENKHFDHDLNTVTHPMREIRQQWINLLENLNTNNPTQKYFYKF